MINKIIDGISIALNAEFGDNYKIHTESVKQGLKEPCFFIVCLNPTNNQFMGNRYFRQNQFDIHYHPKSTDEKQQECMDVEERLFDCLELIRIDDGLQKGTQMHGEMVDGVLHFFVNYDMFVYKIKNQTDPMASMGLETKMKG